MNDEPMIPPEKWDAARLPDGFTAADGVLLMAVEAGLSPEPWQFDWVDKVMRQAQ